MIMPRHPQFSLPYTVISEKNAVHLVAGEDFRYAIEGVGIEQWLPSILEKMDGNQTLSDLEQLVAHSEKASFRSVMQHLCGERVVVEGFSPGLVKMQGPTTITVMGQGLLQQTLEHALKEQSNIGTSALILCQDSLDYEEALTWNQQALLSKLPFVWLTIGPLTRAYLSPLFLPEAGPCLACVFTHFQRLSPLPELYDQLILHKQQGGKIHSAKVEDTVLKTLSQLAVWKLHQAVKPELAASAYQLHVLEISSFEISTHEVRLDPFCTACLGRR